MANIYKRDDKNGKHAWRVQIRLKGMPSINKTFATEEEAKIYANQTEQAMLTSRNGTFFELPKLPFSVWVHRWLEDIHPHRKNGNREVKLIEFWKEKIGDRIAIELTPVFIEGCADELLKKISNKYKTYLSPESRRKYLMFLSSMYTCAMKNWKWAVFNPLTSVNLIRDEHREKKSIMNVEVPNFMDFKREFNAIIVRKMKEKNIFSREASSLSGMVHSTFQNAIDKDSPTSLPQIIKICNAFGLKLRIE